MMIMMMIIVIIKLEWLMLVQCLLHSRLYSESFMFIKSFGPHNHSPSSVLALPTYYKLGKWCTESLSNFHKML